MVLSILLLTTVPEGYGDCSIFRSSFPSSHCTACFSRRTVLDPGDVAPRLAQKMGLAKLAAALLHPKIELIPEKLQERLL